MKKTKDELVADIMQTALTVQNTTKHCVFIEFSGHVNVLTISVRESREDYSTVLAIGEVRLNKSPNETQAEFDNNVIARLELMKRTLVEFTSPKEHEFTSIQYAI